MNRHSLLPEQQGVSVFTGPNSFGQKGLWFIVPLDDRQVRAIRQSRARAMIRDCTVMIKWALAPVRIPAALAAPVAATTAADAGRPW